MPSLRASSAAIRASPHVGFSRTISTISSLRSLGNFGRPPRDFHRQKSWKARWCQLIKVSGFTTTRALRQGNQRDQNSIANLAESVSR